MGTYQPIYAKYEYGQRKPDYYALINICQVLNVSANWLLGLEPTNDTGWRDRALKVESLLEMARNIFTHLNVPSNYTGNNNTIIRGNNNNNNNSSININTRGGKY